jgi:hypothetical protein
MFLLSLIEGISGLVLWIAFPLGNGLGHHGGRVFWSISHDTWLTLHDWVGVALAVIVVVHMIIHWKWIVRMAKTCCRPQKPRI